MASSASPPVIPITTAQAAAANPSSVPPAAAARQLLSRVTETVQRSLAHGRPWAEVLDRSALTRPDSLSDATSRLRKNLSYFRANYAAVLAGILAASLLSQPISLLLLLSLLAAWCFLYLFRPSDPPLVILGRTVSDREALGGLILLTIVVVFLTNVGSLLISAMMIGGAVICAHGAFRVPEDLFLDDQEPGGAATGFLSFLGGAPSSTGPAVAVRV